MSTALLQLRPAGCARSEAPGEMASTVRAPLPTLLQVAPSVGGAIASFTHHGIDVLRPTSAEALAAGDVRSCACYPLAPYSNRIAHARLQWQGRDYKLARNFGEHPHSIHGVGWQRPWQVVHGDASSAQLAFEHRPDAGNSAAWPFAFMAQQHFSLHEAGPAAVLTMTLTLENRAPQAFPFGLGWHPFFPRTPATTLQASTQGVWLNDDTQLPLQHAAVPAAWRFANAKAPPEGLDNVFTQWAGVATLASVATGHTTHIEADSACNHLVVFVPAGRDFLAVEPVTHMTDAFNRAAAGEANTGMRVLAPGQTFSCTMRIIATHSPLP